MFYSHDLLGRKSPLGAIWTMAHGKKLSKCKILGINVADVCKHILQPDVPHSLRLQGILIGGVVIVFNKQQLYLLEDLQDMLRKVKAASIPETAAVNAINTMLQKGRDKARVEAITMEELDLDQMLVMPTDALGQIQDMEDMELADPHQRRRSDVDLNLINDDTEPPSRVESFADDLFMLPTLAPPSTQDGATLGTQRGRGYRVSATTEPSTRDLRGMDVEELFDAPDLQLFMDEDDTGADDAYFLALGGLGAKPPAAAPATATNAPAATATTTPAPTETPNATGPTRTHTPTIYTAPGTMAPPATAAAGGAAIPEFFDDLATIPSDLNSLLDIPIQEPTQQQPLQRKPRQPRRCREDADLATIAMEGEEEEREGKGEEEEEEEQQGLVLAAEEEQQDTTKSSDTESGQRRTASVAAPALSEGGPPELFMPPSPELRGLDLGVDGAGFADVNNDTNMGSPDLNQLGNEQPNALPDLQASESLLFRSRRRRNSDEDNDSVSLIADSLLASEVQGAGGPQVVSGLAAPSVSDGATGGDVAVAAAPSVPEQPQNLRSAVHRNPTATRPKRRRPGARVALDSLEELVIPAITYREWTLNPGALRRRQRASGVTSAAPYGDGGGASRRRNSVPVVLPAVVGACMDAAVAAALAARDVDAAIDVVHQRPAAVMGGMGLGLAAKLVRLVTHAVAEDVIEMDEDVDAPFKLAAAGGRRPKRLRVTKVQQPGPAAPGSDSAAQQESSETNTAAASSEQQPQVSVGRSSPNVRFANQQQPTDSQGQQETQQTERTEQTELTEQTEMSGAVWKQRLFASPAAQHQHHRQDADQEQQSSEVFGAAAPQPGGAAAAGMDGAEDMMMEDMMGLQMPLEDMPPMEDEEDIEMERMRAEHTPNGSAAERQRQAARRAALGLTPGGSGLLLGSERNTSTKPGTSRATSGQTSSSLGQESENEGVIGATTRARTSGGTGGQLAGGGVRFGNGALEDLLPAINEGDMAMEMEFDDGEDEEAPLPSGERPGESSGAGTSGEGTSGRRSRSRRTQGTSGEGNQAFHLQETNGRGFSTQLYMQQAHISRTTQNVVSIYRQRLEAAAASHRPEAEDCGREVEPVVSLFGLATQLTRAESVKLFYQTLVTQTLGFVRASQEEPYGDIIIRAGRLL